MFAQKEESRRGKLSFWIKAACGLGDLAHSVGPGTEVYRWIKEPSLMFKALDSQEY